MGKEIQLPNFKIAAAGPFSAVFMQHGIVDFHAACAYVKQLPYGRNTDRTDFTLVLKEEKGTCSSKHALLVALAEENAVLDVELIAGIFLMNAETHPVLAPFFQDKPYPSIPECHCYIRYKGERIDLTDTGNGMERIASKLVREQRIEPQQVVEWKPVIHRDYLQRWVNRNRQFDRTLEQVWDEREECIRLFQ